MTDTEEQIEWAEREPLAEKLLSMVEIGPKARAYAHPNYCVDSNIDAEWVDPDGGKCPDRFDAVLFIDDNPRANWFHQCRYVFLCDDKAVTVRGQYPPLEDFNYWRIMPRKWDPESDYTKQAEALAARIEGHNDGNTAVWWRVVPAREALAHVGSRGCLVRAPSPLRALQEALSSETIQDWQEPMVQRVGIGSLLSGVIALG